MAATENKSLEIGVVVNEGQMSKFNTAIRDATREVSKLTAELNRAASAFKGFLSGAQMQGGGTFRPGSGFARAPQAQGGGVTQPALAIASAIKATAKESTDALRGMDQTVRTTSAKMAGSIDLFDRALSNVEKRLKNIKTLGAGGAMMPGMGGSAGMSVVPPGGRVVRQNGIDVVVPGPTTLERMTNRLFQPLFGGGGSGSGAGGGQAGGGGLGAGANRLANLLGVPPWAMGAAGAAGGILGGYGAFTSGVVNRESNVSNEVLAAQTDNLRRQAMMQQSVGNLSMQIRRDPLTQFTMGRMTPGDLHAGLSQETFRAMLQQAYQKAGVTGRIGDVSRDVIDRLTALGTQITGSDLPYNNTIQKANLDRAANDIRAQLMQREAEMVQQRTAALPVEERTYIPEFHGEVGTQLSRIRGLGRGGVRRDPKTGRITADPGAGYDIGLFGLYGEDEISGQAARIGGTAGMGARSQGLAAQTLGAQYGGLTNAVDLYNVGAQYRNPGLLNTAQGGVGVDPTATSQLGNIVAQQMTQGNYSIGGSSALQGMGAAFSTGTTGGDMRMARMAGGGVASYDAMLSGGVDNLQKAINVLSANKAAAGMSVQAKHALEGIGSVQLMQIMRSGKLPQELVDYGITMPMINAYVATQNRYAYSRYITGTGNGGDVEAAVLGARKAGGAGNYIQGLMQGRTFKNKREQISFIQDQARLLGQAQHQMGLTPTTEAGTARVLMELGQNEGLVPNMQGGGAYDPGRNTAAAAAKNTQDIAKQAKLDWLREHPEIATTANDVTTAAAGAYGAAAVGGDAAALHKALLGIIDELKTWPNLLRRARSGGNEKASSK
jgi:hypothetical protein